MFSFPIPRQVGIVLILAIFTGCARHRSGDSNVPSQHRIDFAWSVPGHLDDLVLLREKLQAGHIECSTPVSDSGVLSFVVLKNFDRARNTAEKIIQDNSLTVNLEIDPNGYGYEVFEKGINVRGSYF